MRRRRIRGGCRLVALAGVLAGVFLWAGACRAADSKRDTLFWVAPCDDPKTGCQPGDLDLARWALQAWQAASNGRLHFVETNDRRQALIRVVWASPQGGLYGETAPMQVNGRRGAQIFVVNSTRDVTDALLRDTIVYLTCLHESGHALGLRHTDQFDDIMYSFQYGGDIPEYFGRYRRKLAKREDIRRNSGLSEADRMHLTAALEGGAF
ncbi:MAG TPA: matrixin family metalloprotease [Bryobacteraceae bacterium]|nr:matrixin family metalloprotease [Bryobacteraceae bacterium]